MRLETQSKVERDLSLYIYVCEGIQCIPNQQRKQTCILMLINPHPVAQFPKKEVQSNATKSNKVDRFVPREKDMFNLILYFSIYFQPN